jgi:SAM-dependent methyltransferase
MAGLELLLGSLTRAVQRAELPRSLRVGWSRYEQDNSYSRENRQKKHDVVREFVARRRPNLLLDVGCNTGEYSALALDAGAASVVGIERDTAAVNAAVERAESLKKPFLPLQMDVQNVSPRIGWGLAERLSFPDRVTADATLCLALVHHLVLGEGVPLERVIAGVIELAPTGLIEFVPREDDMARRIAGPAERMHHPYDLQVFLSILGGLARIERQTSLGDGGRVLVEYRRSR